MQINKIDYTGVEPKPQVIGISKIWGFWGFGGFGGVDGFCFLGVFFVRPHKVKFAPSHSVLCVFCGFLWVFLCMFFCIFFGIFGDFLAPGAPGGLKDASRGPPLPASPVMGCSGPSASPRGEHIRQRAPAAKMATPPLSGRSKELS